MTTPGRQVFGAFEVWDTTDRRVHDAIEREDLNRRAGGEHAVRLESLNADGIEGRTRGSGVVFHAGVCCL